MRIWTETSKLARWKVDLAWANLARRLFCFLHDNAPVVGSYNKPTHSLIAGRWSPKLESVDGRACGENGTERHHDHTLRPSRGRHSSLLDLSCD